MFIVLLIEEKMTVTGGLQNIVFLVRCPTTAVVIVEERRLIFPRFLSEEFCTLGSDEARNVPARTNFAPAT